MSGAKIPEDPVPSEFQVTILESQGLRCVYDPIDLEGGRLGPVQYFELGDFELDSPGWKVPVLLAFESGCHLALDGQDPFISQDMGPFMAFFVPLGIKNNLGDAFPIPKIDKNQISKIPATVHPAHEQGFPAYVFRPQASAVMGPFPVSLRINLYPLYIIHIHSCPKTVFVAWGSLFKITTHQTPLLVTAPIAATNGIEDRHKEGSVLKQPCSVGLLSHLQYFGTVPLPLNKWWRT